MDSQIPVVDRFLKVERFGLIPGCAGQIDLTDLNYSRAVAFCNIMFT